MTQFFNVREILTEKQRRERLRETFTMSSTSRNAPITEHPEFNRKRYDWGVKPAWSEPVFNKETGELLYEIEHPEDRSGHLPQFDGMAWADFWDAEKEEFRADFPLYKCFLGVKNFIQPGTRFEP